MEEEKSETDAAEKDEVGNEKNRCELKEVSSRKSSSDSKFDSDEDEEETVIRPLSPTDSPVPQEEQLDEGEEADSESEESAHESKPEKKVKAEKKRKKRKRKDKDKMFSNEFSQNNGEQRKRTKTQPNKRKKIRKLLKEDELQQETRIALKEEEERKKRLELQAQLTNEARTNASQNDANNSAAGDVSFLLGDGSNFGDLAYDLEFADDIEPLNYQDMPDNDFNALAATPVSEFEALLSPAAAPDLVQQNSAPGHFPPATDASTPVEVENAGTSNNLHPCESTNSLSSEVARFEQILRSTPPTGRRPSSGGLQMETDLHSAPGVQTLPASMGQFHVDQPPRPHSSGATGQTLRPPSGQMMTPPTITQTTAGALPMMNLQNAMNTSNQSPHLQGHLTAQDAMSTSFTHGMNGNVHTTLVPGSFKRFQSLQAFKPPPTPPAAKPAQQSSDVICISSESSDDEVLRKRATTTINAEPINISSGTDSSDDVIFAGTDDNEIVEDDPDVNNSGMHVNDSMNQPDMDGRVLVNKNRPPDEPEIFLSPHLAAAVKPHQIGGIRFMFDNIVESLEHCKKSSGFGCILAHSMGLGKTLQVIAFIDLFLRHTGAKTALCVVPVNTLLNWVSEFELWLPTKGEMVENQSNTSRNFKVRLLSDAHKTTEARAMVISSWKEDGGVLLMGYEMFRLLTNQKLRKKRKKKQKRSTMSGDVIETIDLDEEDRITEMTSQIYEQLVQPGPDLIVCDEGHRIKNSHASISQALKQIATRRRIVLTGYPLQNNLMEYWCMVDFVRPNFLGTRQEFSNMFERPILNGQCADSNEADIRLMRFRSHVLHSLLKGFVQRRSHVVLRDSLPPKEEYVLMIRFSQWQKKLYNYFIKYQMKSGNGGWNSSLNPIKAFSICCKIWNHPDVLYRTIVRKTLEQQSSNNLLDMDLDLPDVVLDGVVTKQRRKRREISNVLLSDICSRTEPETTLNLDRKIIQTQGIGPLAQDDRDKGLSYEWAKLLLQDYSPNQLEVSGKMLILMEIVHHSVANGDKILVFSQSLMTLTLIEEFLYGMNVPNPPGCPPLDRKWRRNDSYFRLDGNTSTTDRERMVHAFNSKTNDSIHLFLLSTRAGCLGINLIGANRVVVFDISWNPCHDAQAVCRVYRYGQTKRCLIYRLICDQSMEKKIYDRQISKQGMSDRVVDELNPIQSLERQDITKLLIYDDEEKPHIDMSNCDQECSDATLVHACKTYGQWLTKTPFHHESLLMDCKSQRLTKAEKRAAQQGYEQEKLASSSCNYSRPSYASFYAAGGYPTKRKGGNSSILPNSSSAANGDRPVANVRPVQSSPYPLRIGGSAVPGITGVFDQQTIAYLLRCGINVRKIIADADIPMPNQPTSPGAGPPAPLVAKGHVFYMISGKKGRYIGTTNGRIFALRSSKDEERKTESPLVRSFTGQMITTREHESHVIKSVFSSVFHPMTAMQQPLTRAHLPPGQPAAGLPGASVPPYQSPVQIPSYGTVGPGSLMSLMTGRNDNLAGLNMMNQQPQPRGMMTQQNNMLTQQNQPVGLANQQNQPGDLMTQQNPMLTQQNQPDNSMTQLNVPSGLVSLPNNPTTDATSLQSSVNNQSNVLTQQNNVLTQHSNTPTQYMVPSMASTQNFHSGHYLGQSGGLSWMNPAPQLNTAGLGSMVRQPESLTQQPGYMMGQQSSYLSGINMWPPRMVGHSNLAPPVAYGDITKTDAALGVVDQTGGQQGDAMTQQTGLTTQPIGQMTQLLGAMTQPVRPMTQQIGAEPTGLMTQQIGAMNQQIGQMTQLIGTTTQPVRPMTQQVGMMTHQIGSMTQQNETMTLQNDSSMDSQSSSQESSFPSLASLISDAPSSQIQSTVISGTSSAPDLTLSTGDSMSKFPQDPAQPVATKSVSDVRATADFPMQYFPSSTNQLPSTNSLLDQAPPVANLALPTVSDTQPTSLQSTNEMQFNAGFSDDWQMS